MNNETKITVLEHQMTQIQKDVSSLRKETKQGFKSIENKLDCYVPRVEYEKDMRQVGEKLNKSSGNWDWVIKTIMALIIGALITKILMG